MSAFIRAGYESGGPHPLGRLRPPTSYAGRMTCRGEGRSAGRHSSAMRSAPADAGDAPLPRGGGGGAAGPAWAGEPTPPRRWRRRPAAGLGEDDAEEDEAAADELERQRG